MNEQLNDVQVEAALQNCADEPVHIPGIIQPFGWLLAYHVETQDVAYASNNAADALARPLDEILGCHVRDLLGRDVWHALQNFLSMKVETSPRSILGSWRAPNEGQSHLVAAWRSGDFVVVELEPEPGVPLLSAEDLQIQTTLINQVQAAQDIQSLLDLTTKQLKHLTGFDRVMIYRFDQDWNGEIISETRSSAVESFLGLNFPSFDIPAQARAMMSRIPLRLIADIDQAGVPISAASPDLPPLDISLGETRGTSPVHIQYLRNMGSQATMTLSIVVDDALWGIVSFHHRRPRVVPPQIRVVLKSFLGVFCLKLGLLIERDFRALSEAVDHLQQDVHSLINTDPSLNDLLEALGARLADSFGACGFYIQSEEGEFSYGEVPGPQAVSKLIDVVRRDQTSPYFSDNLAETVPGAVREDFAPVAGAAAVANSDDWLILIFRAEAIRSVSWAGDPEKTIETVNGMARLSPRGSFSTYLAETRGRAKAWTGEDRILTQKLWPLLSAALNSEQKRRYMRDLNRQQELMIDELNHRVRNILALVQSVSKEAKKSQSSLESYSQAIEARIRALAAAHSIGSGSSAKKVDIADIILQEAKPYEDEAGSRVRISGTRMAIAPDLAPIFALTIHELMTNAAKYGALSDTKGTVMVAMQIVSGDLEISWTEKDGPPVRTPEREGFGTTLVKRAVPYELGGQSTHEFLPEGVQARIVLPAGILLSPDPDETSNFNQPDFASEDINGPVIPRHLKESVALVVEDNFMIAEGVAQQLFNLGFMQVEAAASLEVAMEFLEDQTPGFAILDVNLGHGQTSLPIAEILLDRRVPIVFATGYGEMSDLTPRLSKELVLTKPIDGIELARAIARVAG